MWGGMMAVGAVAFAIDVHNIMLTEAKTVWNRYCQVIVT